MPSAYRGSYLPPCGRRSAGARLPNLRFAANGSGAWKRSAAGVQKSRREPRLPGEAGPLQRVGLRPKQLIPF